MSSVGGFHTIFYDEGRRDLYPWNLPRGTVFGISNGALQFMGYDELKGWAFERKWRHVAKLGRPWTTDDEKLVRLCAGRPNLS